MARHRRRKSKGGGARKPRIPPQPVNFQPHTDPLSRPDPLTRFLTSELESTRAAWTVLVSTTSPLPRWTWEEVNEALLDLTSTPVEELIIRGALSGVAKQAPYKPADRVLSDIIRVAVAASDQGFFASARTMLEAEMP